MIAALQDALSHNQNWTLVSLLAAVLLSVIGLVVWLVKWLCGRFVSSIDRATDVADKASAATAANTTAQTRIVEHLDRMALAQANMHEEMRRTLETVHVRTVDELQRRRIG